jgi:hypothetical protein
VGTGWYRQAVVVASASSSAAGSDTHNMADAAKQYLDRVFANQTEALQRVQEAWDEKSGQGIAGVWAVDPAGTQAHGLEQTAAVHCASSPIT